MKFDLASIMKQQLEKTATEPKRNIQEILLDIIHPQKGKMMSVAEKVKEMQDRAGVTKLRQIKKAELDKLGFLAYSNAHIELFKEFPALKPKIVDFIEKNPYTDIPAIKNKLRAATQALCNAYGKKELKIDELLEEPSLNEFIDKCVENEKKSSGGHHEGISMDYDREISDRDRAANDDILSTLQPNK